MGLIRIRMPNSSYKAYVYGVTGTRTRGQIVYGTYNHRWRAHEFDIKISGNYTLHGDRDRNDTYANDGDWSDISGNFLPGDDFTQHLEGHGTGAGFNIATDDILDGNVSQAKTSSFEAF